MGYFSQRKKRERENIFLKVMFITLGLLTVVFLLPLSDTAFFAVLKRGLFQFYLLNLVVFFYSLYLARFAYSAVFALFLIINFIQIASTGNLFFNVKVADEHHLTLTYQPNAPLTLQASGMVVLRAGHLNLSPRAQAQFTSFEKNDHVFTAIDVDFSPLSAKERRQAFRKLRTFILMQDDPVIVIGDFGTPSWSPEMKKFLTATELKVKNRMLLSSPRYAFNPLAVPQFYILAFDNVGVMSLGAAEDGNKPPRVNAVLGFY